jgi:hypothetical protein
MNEKKTIKIDDKIEYLFLPSIICRLFDGCSSSSSGAIFRLKLFVGVGKELFPSIQAIVKPRIV